MQQKRIVGMVCAGAVCAAILMAAEPWKSKESAQWTDDDINKVLTDSPWAKEKTVSPQRQQPSGGRGMGRRGGGGGGGYPGGGGGGGYPGGGGSNRRSPTDSYSDADRALMSDLMNPSYSLMVVPKANEVEMSDEQDRKRAMYTDGRKVEKSTSDAFREVTAKWDGDRLVATEDGPKKGTIERILSPADGGAQLYETFRVLDTKSNTTLTVRYVFDRVQDTGQPGR